MKRKKQKEYLVIIGRDEHKVKSMAAALKLVALAFKNKKWSVFIYCFDNVK